MKPKRVYTITPQKFLNDWENGKDVSTLVSKINWVQMSMYTKVNTDSLPETFLRQFVNYINWLHAYKYQKIPEDLLESTGYELIKWDIIVKFQSLTEEFMEKHIKKLKFELILRYQKYSENFILKHFTLSNWNIISYTIKITNPQLKPYVKKENNWLYLCEELRLKLISTHYNIVTIEGKKYIECFKAVRNNYTSIYAPHLKFNKRDFDYETVCDYNYNNFNSYGFGCWTFEEAKNFAQNKKIQNYKILKLLVPFESCCWTGNFRSNCNFPNIMVSQFMYRQKYGYIGKLRTSKFKIINFDVPN